MVVVIADPLAVITKLGIAYIKSQQLANEKVYFSGFTFGSSNAMVIKNTLTSVAGDVSYMGTTDKMFYSTFHGKEFFIDLYMDENDGDYDIGSFSLNVGPGVPFIIGKLDYIHRKMKTGDYSALIRGEPSDKLKDPGGTFIIRQRFVMQNVENYFDLQTMTEKYMSIDDTHINSNTLEDQPNWRKYPHVLVDQVPQETGRKAHVFSGDHTGREWRAGGIQQKMTDIDFGRISGGKDGDNRQNITVTA